MGKILGFMALAGLAVIFYKEYQTIKKSQKSSKLIKTKKEDDNLE